MSTRCNIRIEDGHESLWFYRHSDGYPSVTGESLKRFMRWLIGGRIRDNVEQSAGWLVLLGAIEYQTLPASLFPEADKEESWKRDGEKIDKAMAEWGGPGGKKPELNMSRWKCGAYEPATGRHGDIEYLYVIDLSKKELACYKTSWDDETKDRLFYTVTAENIGSPIVELEPAE